MQQYVAQDKKALSSRGIVEALAAKKENPCEPATI